MLQALSALLLSPHCQVLEVALALPLFEPGSTRKPTSVFHSGFLLRRNAFSLKKFLPCHGRYFWQFTLDQKLSVSLPASDIRSSRRSEVLPHIPHLPFAIGTGDDGIGRGKMRWPNRLLERLTAIEAAPGMVKRLFVIHFALHYK